MADDENGDRSRPRDGGASGSTSGNVSRLKVSRGVVTEAGPGRGEGAGRVHIIRKADLAAYADQETRLFIGRHSSGRLDVETPLAEDVLRTGRPLGMLDDKVFGDFKAVLRDRLPDLPKDTRFAVRGSAITGDGFLDEKRGYSKDFFDIGRSSDWDVAIVSPTLFEKARKLGVELRQGGRRTVVLDEDTLRELGLIETWKKIRAFPRRKKSELMIYASPESLNSRGPNITFDLEGGR